ncbi:hypothetical protein H2248_001481 [Termitomyces sp. 'cryptogamus']|nr:hypothetical protein H2248_001481 [Termitomyces sp. 'cryptogamus']
MTNPPDRDARLRELLADPRLNAAIRRPLQFGARKEEKVLEGFVPLDDIPGYLCPGQIPGRSPPTMYYGYPVPASLLEKHWNEEVRSYLDTQKMTKEALEDFQDPDPHKAFEAFLVTVLLDLADELCEETGWGIQMNKVYGIPGDPYHWMASLCGNYSGTDVPEPHIKRLREALGAEGPPMWYLAYGDDGQWDTKGSFMPFDPERLIRALGYGN